MRQFNSAGNCARRALFRTERTAAALVLIYRIGQKLTAFADRTALFVYMRFIFIPKIADSRQYGIRRGLTETAQRAVLDAAA